MSSFVETLNLILATGGLVLFGITVFLLYDLYTDRVFATYVRRFTQKAAFLLTVGGVFVTLLYSEVFGFVPCGLCWMQRVFLYPQAIILGVSLYIKDSAAIMYTMVLSVGGLIVGLYQHYLQMGGAEFVACPTSGGDCSKRILFEYGFMTFPLLSVSLFTFLSALYFYYWKIE